MVIGQYRLTNNSNSKGIKFHYARGVNQSVTIQNIKIKSPGNPASSNYAANWGGFDRIISVEFVLRNDGTDKSTNGSSKVTLSQQEDFLLDEIIQGDNGVQSNVSYTLRIYRDGAAKTYTGVVEDISLNSDISGDSTQITGTLNFYEAS